MKHLYRNFMIHAVMFVLHARLHVTYLLTSMSPLDHLSSNPADSSPHATMYVLLQCVDVFVLLG